MRDCGQERGESDTESRRGYGDAAEGGKKKRDHSGGTQMRTKLLNS